MAQHIHSDECDDSCEEEVMNPALGQFDQETQEQIQQIQMLEQNFQQILQQKQIFSMELTEVDYAIKEVEKSDGEMFKIVAGQVVIKSTKEILISELKHKKDLLALRLKNIETQEGSFSSKIEDLREKLIKKLAPENNNPSQ